MPHRIERDWVTKAGLRAVILVCQFTKDVDHHRCGYIGVPEGHWLFGLNYHDHIQGYEQYANCAVLGQKSLILALTAECHAPEGETVAASPEILLDCHGGLTYSTTKKDYPSSYPVESKLWWHGFDCNHYKDGTMSPESDGHQSSYPPKSEGFCIHQLESLANQILELSPVNETTTQ